MNRSNWIPSTLLILTLVTIGGSLTAWKAYSRAQSAAEMENQYEPAEVVEIVFAERREHQPTSTSIGTVLAIQSVTLRNELPGTVRHVALAPGSIVEAGDILVGLDISVEEAELQALEAQAVLGEANLQRARRLLASNAGPSADVERTLAERDVIRAQIARTRAIIERKTIRAPFRARVGLADVHSGQFLEAGTFLTTLQGLDAAAHIDFEVTQSTAAAIEPGDRVELVTRNELTPFSARIVAVDARVDRATRNATVRARVDHPGFNLPPGASVRVQVPEGDAREVVAIPANALRRSPSGDHVFVIEMDSEGDHRAHARTVQTGLLSAREVLVLSGIAPGERVAASGSFKLRDAALVHPAEEPVLTSQIR